MAKHTHNSNPLPTPVEWSVGKKTLVSAILIFHLLAVFLPPFAFETSSIPGTGSPLAQPLMRWFGPYVDAAYLNHGYAFFAPDPGSSFLLRATMESASCKRPAVFPVL